jgi:hypothetical protein
MIMKKKSCQKNKKRDDITEEEIENVTFPTIGGRGENRQLGLASNCSGLL